MTTYAVPRLARIRSFDAEDPLRYPDSDGEPMADNDQQFKVMVDTRLRHAHPHATIEVLIQSKASDRRRHA